MNAHQWNAVAEVLRTADFPVNRQDLINHARGQGGDDATVALLWDLPLAIFRNLVDVRDALLDVHDAARDLRAA